MINALQKRPRQSWVLDDLRIFIKEESLNRSNFRQLDRMLFQINSEVQKGKLSRRDITEIHSWFADEFLQETVHGRGFRKPNGYPGDYQFLDSIYTNRKSLNLRYRIWDEYMQQHAAPNAVRNRKEFFKKLAFEKALRKPDLNILNVVSGSGRELFEMYQSLPNKRINTTCVEIDDEAINFSKKLNKKHQDNIEYVHSNVFRYKTNNTFDLIWSAGLFDYLNDKAFLMLLERFKGWLSHKGEIVIGNYNEAFNPSRDYMEILGDWHLIHRTTVQLYELAQKAGFKNSQIKVTHREDKVILYLHLKMN